MIRLEGEITYHDGRTETILAEHGEMAAWELYALRMGIPPVDPTRPTGAPTPMLMMLYLGYAAAHRGTPRADWPVFEDWSAGVSQVDLAGDPTLKDEGVQEETLVFPPARSAG